jgi:3'-phosphoadenosine 5'-phosphosulfate synthase
VFLKDRQRVRKIHQKSNLPFIEVYLKTSLEVCENRDVRGLYKKARSGELKNFTGIDSAYEVPTDPEIILDTNTKTVDECVQIIFDYIMKINRSRNQIVENFNETEFLNRELFVRTNLETQLEEAKHLPQLEMNTIELQWVQVLSEGWAYPLRGFMNEDEYLQTLHFNSIRRNGN